MSEQLRSPKIPVAVAAFSASWLAVGLVDAMLSGGDGFFGTLFTAHLAGRTLAALLVAAAAFRAADSNGRRRVAEEARQRSDEQCAAALEATGDAICIVEGGDLRIVSANRAFSQGLSISTAATGSILSDVLRFPQLAEAARVLIGQCSSATPATSTVEIPGEPTVAFELSARPVPAEDPAAPLFLLAWHDLSVEKRYHALEAAASEPYRALIENLGAPTAIALPGGKLFRVNRAFEEMTGFQAAELEERMSVTDFMTGEAQDELLQQWRMQSDEGESVRDFFETTIVNREGVERPVAVERAVISGTPHAVITLRDLGPQKRLEAELRESNATLAMVQRISRMGTWEWDVTTDAMKWSEEMFRVFRVDPEEYVPSFEGYVNAVHPEEREMVILAVNNALYNKKPFGLDHRMTMADGTVRTISARAEVTFDGQGNPLRMVGTNQDISWRVEAEQALRNSEEKFSKAFHASPDSIVITRADDGTYIDVNEAFQEMTGYSREEVIGRSSYADLKLWVDPDARMMMLKLMNQYGHVRNLEVRFRVKSGEIKELLWSADVIEYGGEACLIAISRDVTEQRHLEQELLKSEAKLYMKHEELKNLFQQMEGIRREWEETVDCISDLFILSDQWGRIRRFNRAVEEFTGRAHRDIVGKDCHAFLDELGLRKHLETPGVELLHEESGKWFVVKRYSFPSTEGDGTMREVVLINDTTDIGRRNASEGSTDHPTAPPGNSRNINDLAPKRPFSP